MGTINYNTNEQVYYVREDDTLSSRVALVICVLVPRGLCVAGFSITKELLTIQYKGYNKNKPVWELDFFEHIFANEPILAIKEKIKGVFICSDKSLIVPNELYMEEEAQNWLKHIHYVEAGDVITSYPLADEKANYLHAVPLNIIELIKINFKNTEILPLSIYQFRNPHKQTLHLQCCLTGEQACISLHNNSQLLWQSIFNYACAEDIAYKINLYCLENNIDTAQLGVMCNGLSATEYERINELTQYFPGIRAGNGHTITGSWDTAISLANQLFACVS